MIPPHMQHRGPGQQALVAPPAEAGRPPHFRRRDGAAPDTAWPLFIGVAVGVLLCRISGRWRP